VTTTDGNPANVDLGQKLASVRPVLNLWVGELKKTPHRKKGGAGVQAFSMSEKGDRSGGRIAKTGIIRHISQSYNVNREQRHRHRGRPTSALQAYLHPFFFLKRKRMGGPFLPKQEKTYRGERT